MVYQYLKFSREMVTTRSSKTKVSEKKVENAKKDEEMEVEKTEEDKAIEKRQLIVEDIRAQFKELEKAASQKEPRQVAKVCFREHMFSELFLNFLV